MDVELVQHPPRADADVDRNFHCVQHQTGGNEHHEESFKVPPGQLERDQCLRRCHRCIKLRARALRIHGTGDFAEIRGLRELPALSACSDFVDQPGNGPDQKHLSYTEGGAAEIGVGSVRDQLEEFFGCVRMSSPTLGSVQWIVHQWIHEQQSLLEEEESSSGRS